MISARQNKNMLEWMFASGADFTAPTAIFTVSPNTYTTAAVPAGVTLSGTITLNDATLTDWTIMQGTTMLATGTGTSVSHALVTIPSAVGTTSYSLVVNYTDNNSNALSLVVPTSVVVTAVGLYGQLATGVDIAISTDLTALIEATLTSTSKSVIINAFDIVAATTGRIIFIIPDSYGTPTDLEDGSGLDVSSQFNQVVDAINSRTIWTSINMVIPATYTYKFVF